MSNRDEMRRLANESIACADATGWFEELYRRAAGTWDRVPWAELVANPFLVAWLSASGARGDGQHCLVVGCGLGDDAEALAAANFDVIAFDVAQTAIDACRARWNGSRVEYAVATAALASLVAPAGRLLVLCRARDRAEPEGQLPWPLTREELAGFVEHGLTELSCESFFDDESPPVRRFRALYERPLGSL